MDPHAYSPPKGKNLIKFFELNKLTYDYLVALGLKNEVENFRQGLHQHGVQYLTSLPKVDELRADLTQQPEYKTNIKEQSFSILANASTSGIRTVSETSTSHGLIYGVAMTTGFSCFETTTSRIGTVTIANYTGSTMTLGGPTIIAGGASRTQSHSKGPIVQPKEERAEGMSSKLPSSPTP
ncbi:hypothetical protein ACH5RR_012116 [Cinchona calisaya]|uniref:Uncharacterized protein n=1 Tax=Cinchona calisaya TaxID=153742 RepID=A0ABD3AAF9_9GENT